ncbi:MAG: metallophosphoesterase family protein [Lachnospiraceae bacterium]|nr:metallophosphoesterase family protein [Lachnospiraceae bacterium]
MRYYISDLHYFHEGLNERMDCRGFQDLEAMHEYMIRRWNQKVRPNDEVVVLGDLSMGKGRETNEILQRLNGTVYLIRGNHDRFLNDRRFDHSLIRWVKDYEELKDNKRKVILSHYPIFCYNGQYRTDQDGNPRSYMLYGHVHNTFDEQLVDAFIKQTRASERMIYGADEVRPIPCVMINCFCMFSDYQPLTLDEWIKNDKERREQSRQIV